MVRNKKNKLQKKKKPCPADDEPEYVGREAPQQDHCPEEQHEPDSVAIGDEETQQVHDDEPLEREQEEDPEGEIVGEEPVEPVRKKQRGPTRMKKLAKDPNNRERVEFNKMGEPIGPGSVKLSSYLGPLVREHVPLTIGDWRKISEELKTVLWKSIQVNCLSLTNNHVMV